MSALSTEMQGVDSQESVPPVYDKLSEWLVFGQIVSAIFLQKFAVPIADGKQVSLGLLAMLALSGLGLLTKKIEFGKDILFLYLMLIGVLFSTQLLGQHDFSMLSIILVFIVHAPYCLRLKDGTFRENIQLIFYQKMMAIVSILGIFQFFLQFVVGAPIAYFLDFNLPSGLIMQSFHWLNPISNEGTHFKATGVFFLEPAIFCQYLAIAIMVELVYFKNLLRMALYGFTILLTLSGTGLIILFVLLPIYLIQNRRIFILTFMLIGLVLVPFVLPAIGLGHIVDRATEITNVHSSAYARFLSIFRSLDLYILPNNDTLLFGLGAGSILETLRAAHLDYEAHNPSWGKMVFEYGMIGALAYYIFIFYSFKTSRVSAYLKWALVIQLMLLGEYVSHTIAHALIVSLLIWPGRGGVFVEGTNEKFRKFFPRLNEVKDA